MDENTERECPVCDLRKDQAAIDRDVHEVAMVDVKRLADKTDKHADRLVALENGAAYFCPACKMRTADPGRPCPVCAITKRLDALTARVEAAEHGETRYDRAVADNDAIQVRISQMQASIDAGIRERDGALDRAKKAKEERDAAIARAEQAERERDVFRADSADVHKRADEWRLSHSAMVAQRDVLQSERDAARAEVTRLKEMFEAQGRVLEADRATWAKSMRYSQDECARLRGELRQRDEVREKIEEYWRVYWNGALFGTYVTKSEAIASIGVRSSCHRVIRTTRYRKVKP